MFYILDRWVEYGCRLLLTEDSEFTKHTQSPGSKFDLGAEI